MATTKITKATTKNAVTKGTAAKAAAGASKKTASTKKPVSKKTAASAINEKKKIPEDFRKLSVRSQRRLQLRVNTT